MPLLIVDTSLSPSERYAPDRSRPAENLLFTEQLREIAAGHLLRSTSEGGGRMKLEELARSTGYFSNLATVVLTDLGPPMRALSLTEIEPRILVKRLAIGPDGIRNGDARMGIIAERLRDRPEKSIEALKVAFKGSEDPSVRNRLLVALAVVEPGAPFALAQEIAPAKSKWAPRGAGRDLFEVQKYPKRSGEPSGIPYVTVVENETEESSAISLIEFLRDFARIPDKKR